MQPLIFFILYKLLEPNKIFVLHLKKTIAGLYNFKSLLRGLLIWKKRIITHLIIKQFSVTTRNLDVYVVGTSGFVQIIEIYRKMWQKNTKSKLLILIQKCMKRRGICYKMSITIPCFGKYSKVYQNYFPIRYA